MNRKFVLAAVAVLIVAVATALLIPNGNVWMSGFRRGGSTAMMYSMNFGGDHRTPLRIGIVVLGALLAAGRRLPKNQHDRGCGRPSCQGLAA